MPVLNAKRRQGAAIRLADHAESCEVRVLLSGVAIYPQQVEVKEAVPVEPAGKVSPLDLSPSDYNGTWDLGDGSFLLNLSVKGSNPFVAKVTGTVSAPFIVGGSTKFKGKVFKGADLLGKFQTKATQGPITGKLKTQIMVQLSDSTHFEGELTGSINGMPLPSAPATGVKV